MFLHTNFVPKMNLQLPFSMEAYTRCQGVVLHACLQMKFRMPLTSNVYSGKMCVSRVSNCREADLYTATYAHRRWQHVVPGNRSFAEVMAPLGRDVEREAYEAGTISVLYKRNRGGLHQQFTL
jgi:hypothetical protein